MIVSFQTPNSDEGLLASASQAYMVPASQEVAYASSVVMVMTVPAAMGIS